MNLECILTSDDDFADIDLTNSTVKNLFVNHDGQINYNPGNDISMGDVLTGADWGAGNDMAFVWTQNGTINDKDTLSDAYVQNTGSFNQNGDAKGGDAYADEGVVSGGGGGDGGSHAKAEGGDGGNGDYAEGGDGEGGRGEGGEAYSKAYGGKGV